MKSKNILRLVVSLAGYLLLGPNALAQIADNHPGAEVYAQNCASCHDAPAYPEIPSLGALQMMSAQVIDYALTEGVMSYQAEDLTAEQREQTVDYLAMEGGYDAWVANLFCAPEARAINLAGAPALTRFGVDDNNTRYIPAETAGLAKSDMSNLELAWSIAFPEVRQFRSSPVIVGSTMFFPVQGTRKVFAMDTQSGCAKWVYESPNTMRSSLSIGAIDDTGRQAILFGDADGFVQAIDALTGEGIWVMDGKASNNGGRISGAVVLHEDKIIVPISHSGVGAGGDDPTYECCEGHGAVTALDAATGNKLWEYHTMPNATYNGMENSLGVKLKGPSGAPIWTTPTVDARRNSVYITTGENTSHPATETSDAIIALDLDTGAEKWVFQALANDVWNFDCAGENPGPNCPNQAQSELADYDFGGPAVLVETDEGGVLLAGQKSGDLWSVSADTGQVIWNQKVGTGTALGGNHWGIATDSERVFHPINDPIPARDGFTPEPGMYSFFIGTGEPSWSFRIQPDCDNGRDSMVPGCEFRYGLSAAPLVVDGALISASLDGRLFIFDGDNGDILFEFDTATDFLTDNGLPGAGGAIDAHSIAAGDGMIFVGSGYGLFGQAAGNVLLAFKPK